MSKRTIQINGKTIPMDAIISMSVGDNSVILETPREENITLVTSNPMEVFEKLRKKLGWIKPSIVFFDEEITYKVLWETETTV